MYRIGVALAAFLPLILPGCASVRYDWDYDQDVDFARYQTFDWMTPPGTVASEREQFPILALRLKRAFEHELHAIGYDKVDEDPDFLVAFHAASERYLSRLDFDRWGYWHPPRRHPGWQINLVVFDEYERGSLVFDVIDARTEELVWRGVAWNFPYGDGRPDRAKAEETARALLEGFPPPS